MMSSTDVRPTDEWGGLQGQLDEDYPRSWRPGKTTGKDGKKLPAASVDADEVMGTIVRIDWQGVTFNGATRMVPVVVIATHPEGELRSVWAVHAVLAEELGRQAVKDGDRIAIRYLGMQTPKEGDGSYHGYKIAVRRASTGIASPSPSTIPTTSDFGDTAPF